MTSATGGLSGFGAPAQKSPWERRPVKSNSTEAANPFGNQAETVDAAAAEKAAERAAENAPIPVVIAPVPNPFADKQVNDRSRSPSETSPITSPQRAQFGTAEAVPVAAVGAKTSPKAASNVHRVQLDFKPSMDDELELIAGQVVRIIHEYDDGWVS